MNDDYKELDLFFQENAKRIGARMQKLIASKKMGDMTDLLTLAVEGGKKLRPGISILVYRALGGGFADEKDIIDIASIAEFLHSSSLIVDDMLDDDATRRGKPSAHEVFGHAASLVGAGAMMVLTFKIGIERSTSVGREAAQMCVDLMSGNQMDVAGIGFDHQQYKEMISLKTASLFKGSCVLGAIMGGAIYSNRDALGEFGFNVGMAYQIYDDLCDVVETEKGIVTGFLSERKVSLPLIFLNDLMPGAPILLKYRDTKQEFTEDDYKELMVLLKANHCIENTLLEAIQYTEKAKGCWSRSNLVSEKWAKLLHQIPEYTRDAIINETGMDYETVLKTYCVPKMEEKKDGQPGP